MERVLPNVWRWAEPEGDRCGTALKTEDGLVLVDPPALARDERVFLEGAAGPVRHVVLTSARHRELAAPYGGARVHVAGGEALPGGLLPCALPLEDEAAVLWPEAGDGLLIVGDALPFIGQTPVYRERLDSPVNGAAGERWTEPGIALFQDTISALLAADPKSIAPAHQAPPDRWVMFATAYAAHIGSPTHARRAAPVEGPRLLVPEAEKVLNEALTSPVVQRRGADGAWRADPFVCSRCGAPNEPMRQTCGGPPIPRQCPSCRAAQRERLPQARLMVCAGGCCTRDGARAVASAAREALAARGLGETVDVVPVTCLGECSIGPFVRLSSAQGEELAAAREYRAETIGRARVLAQQLGETIDDESELVLSRFAALVRPREVARLVETLASPEATPNL